MRTDWLSDWVEEGFEEANMHSYEYILFRNNTAVSQLYRSNQLIIK
jgi:hypothetical protein